MMYKQIDLEIIDSFVENFKENRLEELNHILDNIKKLDFYNRDLIIEGKLTHIFSQKIPPISPLTKLTRAIHIYAISAENPIVFHDMLFEYLARSNMSHKELASMSHLNYNTLNSVLKNNPCKKISREYILKLSIAMKLSMLETDKLLCSAGYILIGLDERDLQLRAAITNGMDLEDINIILHEKGLKLL